MQFSVLDNASFSSLISYLVILIDQNWGLFWFSFSSLLSMLGLSPPAHKWNESIWSIMYFSFRRFLISLPPFAVLIATITPIFYALEKDQNILSTVWRFYAHLGPKTLWAIPAFLLGSVARILFMRKAVPRLSNIRRKITKKQTFDELSDIRNVQQQIQSSTFDPTSYYRQDHIFIALDECEQPIYVDIKTFRENHLQIIGATGFGKGILLGCIIDQIIIAGDTVFYFDPKHDENLPLIMLQRCQELGRKFEYLSLYDGEPGTWNPCLGGSLEEARARIENAIKLGRTGSDADHYKTKERLVIANAFSRSRDLESIAKFCEETLPDSTSAAELKIWRQYKTLCPKGEGTFSVEKSLINNSVVYIKGSLDDAIMLQCFAMLMTEIGQVASRLKSQKVAKKHAFAFWDEVSFYVVPEIPKSLASIRSSGLSFGLAYQSQTDTKNLRDRTVNGEYVFNGVNVNCQLKLVYGGWDDATASWLSKLCGTVTREVLVSSEVSTNKYAGQVWSDKSRINIVEEPLLPANTIKMLPKKVCVFLQPGHLPRICKTWFVTIKNRDLTLPDSGTKDDPSSEQATNSTELQPTINFGKKIDLRKKDPVTS